MKAVVQRVSEAAVEVDARTVARIDRGLLVFLGVEKEDGPEDVAWLARKIPALRIFADDAHNMNRTLRDVAGEILVVSQFTLAGNVGKGRRPSFERAAAPETARLLYDQFVVALGSGDLPVRTGIFGAMMRVQLVNDGPVTFIVDSRRR